MQPDESVLWQFYINTYLRIRTEFHLNCSFNNFELLLSTVLYFLYFFLSMPFSVSHSSIKVFCGNICINIDFIIKKVEFNLNCSFKNSNFCYLLYYTSSISLSLSLYISLCLSQLNESVLWQFLHKYWLQDKK